MSHLLSKLKSIGALIRHLPEFTIVVFGFVLNTIWEFSHSSLYVDHQNGLDYVVRSRLHCAVVDALLLLAAFWLTCLVFRTRQWPTKHAFFGTAILTALGLGYTVWSEWFNTVVRRSWQYTDSMPTIFGIGLTPILQWLVIPTVIGGILALCRRTCPMT